MQQQITPRKFSELLEATPSNLRQGDVLAALRGGSTVRVTKGPTTQQPLIVYPDKICAVSLPYTVAAVRWDNTRWKLTRIVVNAHTEQDLSSLPNTAAQPAAPSFPGSYWKYRAMMFSEASVTGQAGLILRTSDRQAFTVNSAIDQSYSFTPTSDPSTTDFNADSFIHFSVWTDPSTFYAQQGRFLSVRVVSIAFYADDREND